MLGCPVPADLIITASVHLGLDVRTYIHGDSVHCESDIVKHKK